VPEVLNIEVKTAQAACNLLHLGFEASGVHDIARAWAANRVRVVGDFGRYLEKARTVDLQANSCGTVFVDARLCLSFHQFPYQVLYRFLADTAADRTCYLLTGSVPNRGYEKYCEHVSRILKCRLIPLISGPKVLRDAHEIMRSHPLVLFVDAPWSASEASAADEIEYPVHGGRYRVRPAFERLIQKLSSKRIFAAVRGNIDESVSIDCFEYQGLGEAYRKMVHIVVESPVTYQDLDRLHHFMTFDKPSTAGVVFTIQSHVYLLSARSRRCYRLSVPTVIATQLSKIDDLDAEFRGAIAAAAPERFGDLVFIRGTDHSTAALSPVE
jgi:hypothetical protein